MFRMPSLWFLLALGAAVFLMCYSSAWAQKPAAPPGQTRENPAEDTDGGSGVSGSSLAGHLYLYEKDPSTWEIVSGGAWGKMNYHWQEIAYDNDAEEAEDDGGLLQGLVFNGHGLAAGEDYALMYLADPAQGRNLSDSLILGGAAANSGGQVHISANPGQELPSGAKIWLVPRADAEAWIASGTWAAWNPDQYLFEGELMFEQ